MAASFQAKDTAVLGQQLKVQEICLFANHPLLTVSGSDLSLAIGESVGSVLHCAKQVAAGTITGVQCTISGSNIILVGESAAISTTSYVIKFIVSE